MVDRPNGHLRLGDHNAAEAVVRSAGDGYTLYVVNTSDTINATLYDKLNFNIVRDIAPIAGMIRNGFIMVVNPSVPAVNFPEFTAYAKANPGKVSMASGGNGTPAHVTGELFKSMTGVNMLHVPYRGEAPALSDLISGQVQLIFGNMIALIEHVRAGCARWQ